MWAYGKQTLQMVMRARHVLFAVVLATLVLWQLLLPGYVIIGDLVFGPHSVALSLDGLKASNAPLYGLVLLLRSVFAMWLVEKVLLFMLFFFMAYLPLALYPFRRRYGEEFVAALFFVINPFVYERFLIGQWSILYGYVFLFPLVAYLIRYARTDSWSDMVKMFVSLWLIGACTVHILTIGALLVMSFCASMCVKFAVRRDREAIRSFITQAVVLSCAFAAASLYWIMPLLKAKESLGVYAMNDWHAFYTAIDSSVGVIGNVLSMYGFWGEHEKWASFFVLSHSLAFFAMLGVVVMIGGVSLLRQTETRVSAVWLCGIALASVLFSCGITGLFAPMNEWLIGHIFFWKGFRDSQKWSAVIVMVYSLFYGVGVGTIARHMTKYVRRGWLVSVVAGALLVLYTPAMLFGFGGQVHVVWYPEEWRAVNDILRKDSSCRAVFLPWHAYYSASWNYQTLALSSASSYFDCDVVLSKNPEVGTLQKDGASPELDYDAIAALVTSNTGDPDATVAALGAHGVRYIIVTRDLIGEDPYRYPFIFSRHLEVLYRGSRVVLLHVL